MCEKCRAMGAKHSEDRIEADRKAVESLTDIYRSHLKDQHSDVVIPALLQLLRERLENRERATSTDENVEWAGTTLRVLLDGLMGFTFVLEQLVNTSAGLVPLHQVVAEANFMEPTVRKRLN
ncbi:hypothetical protein HWC07_gp046 [Pantoea phage vB_PagM_LIET2]|uniref:Uncharacterized protein n=1 Tax=Pantoea phage vB_PagM_LIET2 TaxID=2508071 RepID=A0A411AW38_9CAUD|nr:hypothetical protein HWC07_gp046 [Pantoea phage vB_PagM_LIET2]QAX92298.1 hypothetical protein LIET2_gp046 [Pantoea phage vB_PagM_LIET2]